MAGAMVIEAGAPASTLIPSVETEGVNVSEPEMLVKALAAADRVMEAKGPLPTALLNTKPPEMTGPSRDNV